MNNHETTTITVPTDRVEIYLLLEEAMNSGDILKAKRLAQDCVSITVNTYQRKPENLHKDSKEYLDLDQGIKAYSRILETGITAQEALEYVAESYGKSRDWVDEVKNNHYLHAKAVFTAHQKHEVQVAMKKDGTLRAKALTTSETPNHQLRELSAQRRLHTTLGELKLNDLASADKSARLEAEVIHVKTDMAKLKTDLNLTGLNNKEVALKMKEAGLTQRVVAEHLGVSLSTVKRWWK